MDKRTFDVPDDLIDEPDVIEVARHFQPGQIFKSLHQESVSNIPKQNIQSTASETKQISSASKDNEVSSHVQPNVEVVSHGSGQSLYTRSVSSTTFGSAFANLKSSKYYEENSADVPEKAARITGALLVNPRQRGNPLLKHIRNVPWEYTEMEPDYVMGKTMCALFLSMKYHNLFPNYIHERLKGLGKSYQLRVLLVQVDVVEPSQALKDLSVIAILADCTLMVAWSAEEAGNYLETYKMFENKSADLIKEKPFDDSFSQVIDCLTSIRSINKTDAAVLLSTFGTLAKVFQASSADLAICPGIGPLKAKRLYEALRKPITNERKRVT